MRLVASLSINTVHMLLNRSQFMLVIENQYFALSRISLNLANTRGKTNLDHVV